MARHGGRPACGGGPQQGGEHRRQRGGRCVRDVAPPPGGGGGAGPHRAGPADGEARAPAVPHGGDGAVLRVRRVSGGDGPGAGAVRDAEAVVFGAGVGDGGGDVRVGSLFAGIGGFDLGLEWAGMEVCWQVEIDPSCVEVLENHWSEVARYGDIRTLDPRDLGSVDLICGGFPCQPVSLAGRRRGQEDERWLWPEFARTVRVVRPRYVLVENVPGLLVRGMGEVLGDLAALGYDAEWDCIPAAAVGAPHLRYRVFIVAYTAGEQGDTEYGRPHRPGECGRLAMDPRAEAARQAHGQTSHDGSGRCGENVAYPPSQRNWSDAGAIPGDATIHRAHECQQPGRGCQDVADTDRIGRHGRPGEFRTGWRGEPADGGGGPAEPRLGREVDGLPPWLDRASLNCPIDQEDQVCQGCPWPARPREPQHPCEPPRVARGIPNRVARIRALGNAVVPQVAEWIGRRVCAHAALSAATVKEWGGRGENVNRAARESEEGAVGWRRPW
ncbi:MAG: DNA (cytosine-5-)-methyltransferase [Bacillota bacterium]|nr:MAG: DNA (cytosine-5-)-methyltransferase [Bacillota bacterium]